MFAWSDAILLPSKTSAEGKFAWENEVLDKSVIAKGGRAYPGGFVNSRIILSFFMIPFLISGPL